MKNQPAYPKTVHHSEGLTKLELISAMCLQGYLACPSYRLKKGKDLEESLAFDSINAATELLRQLKQLKQNE